MELLTRLVYAVEATLGSSSSSLTTTSSSFSSAAGKGKKAAFNPPGLVLTLGSGDCAQLGLGHEEQFRERKFPAVVKGALEGLNITKLAVGALHAAVVTDTGRLYTWGCNDEHALGRGGMHHHST